MFQEMELSYISRNGTFLCFKKRNFLMFQETELSYISGNGNHEILLIFQEVTFRARKMKKPVLKKSSFSCEYSTRHSKTTQTLDMV